MLFTFLQKPWALLHAQLWAEDGSVHLVDQTLYGAGAIVRPYRGYLHLIPRLIAWTAAHLTGVVHWPFVYNLLALLVVTGVYLRYASPRLRLPGKPWIILGFALVAINGEVFLNITNLHWVTSFLILAQFLIDRPKSPLSWGLDLLVLAVAGLTGPFIIVYFPLFVWRCWRERDAYSTSMGAVALACALIQGYFVKTQGAQYFTPALHSNPVMLVAMVGLRLFAWPYLGPAIGMAMGIKAMALVALLGIGLVVASAVRPGPSRTLRLEILAALVMIGAVCMYRIRPDTWINPDLDNGDSYFYIPKVLVLWLVIWTFTDAPRWARLATKSACILGLLLNATSFTKESPPDFDWAGQCYAVVQGIPAQIPTLPEGWVLQYPGRPPYITVNDDWWTQEWDGRHWWCWSAGKYSMRVVPEGQDDVHAHFSLRSLHSEEVRISRGDALLWKGTVGEAAVPVSLTLPSSPSEYAITFTTETPGVKESVETNPRILAFAIYDWRTDPKAP